MKGKEKGFLPDLPPELLHTRCEGQSLRGERRGRNIFCPPQYFVIKDNAVV